MSFLLVVLRQVRRLRRRLPLEVAVETIAGVVTDMGLAVFTLIAAAVVLVTGCPGQGPNPGPEPKVPDCFLSEWRVVAGSEIFAGVPRPLLPDQRIFLVPDASSLERSQIPATFFGLRTEPFDLYLRIEDGETHYFEGYTNRLTKGETISDRVEFIANHGNLVAVATINSPIQGRTLELALVPVGLQADASRSNDAVVRAIREHFFYPETAVGSLSSSLRRGRDSQVNVGQ